MKLPPEFVEMCVGIGGFMVLGGYLGYKLRKLVERVQARRANRRAFAGGVSGVMRESRVHAPRVANPKPEFLPMERKCPPEMGEQHWQEVVHSEERAEVIAALTGCGYKKTPAAKAADACSLVERADLASWIRAALRNASGGAS